MTCFTTNHEDGVLLACGEKRLYKFNRTMGVRTSLADDNPIIFAAYNPNGNFFITAAGRSLKLWDALTGRLEKSFVNIVDSTITTVCIDDRLRRIVVGTNNGKVQVFNINSGSHMKDFPAHKTEVSALTFCPRVPGDELKYVLSGAWDGRVICNNDVAHDYGVNSSSMVKNVVPHDSDVTVIAHSSVHQVVASGSADNSVCFYDWALGSTPIRITLSAGVSAMVFLDPLPLLVVADGTGSLYLLHAVAPSYKILSCSMYVNVVDDKLEAVTSLCWDSTDQLLFSSDDAGHIKRWPIDPVVLNFYKDQIKAFNKVPKQDIDTGEAPSIIMWKPWVNKNPRTLPADPTRAQVEKGRDSARNKPSGPGPASSWFTKNGASPIGKRSSGTASGPVESDNTRISLSRPGLNLEGLVADEKESYSDNENASVDTFLTVDQANPLHFSARDRGKGRKASDLLSIDASLGTQNSNSSSHLKALNSSFVRTISWHESFVKKPTLNVKAHDSQANLSYMSRQDTGNSPVLLSWSFDGHVFLWDAVTGAKLGSLFQGHNRQHPKREANFPWKLKINLASHRHRQHQFLVQALQEPAKDIKMVPEGEEEDERASLPGGAGLALQNQQDEDLLQGFGGLGEKLTERLLLSTSPTRLKPDHHSSPHKSNSRGGRGGQHPVSPFKLSDRGDLLRKVDTGLDIQFSDRPSNNGDYDDQTTTRSRHTRGGSFPAIKGGRSPMRSRGNMASRDSGTQSLAGDRKQLRRSMPAHSQSVPNLDLIRNKQAQSRSPSRVTLQIGRHKLDLPETTANAHLSLEEALFRTAI